MNPKVENLKGKLIVSCQALPDEPLHSSFIMGRMALAAKQGGASGIRANTPEDIKEIKTQVDLPVIGIIKRNYDDCEIYITPTIKEIDELMEAKPEIIALDATISSRPKGQKLDEFFHEIKEKYPDQLLMADCSTIEEALHADELGFDFIGTTMVGYTKQSKDLKIDENDFEILRTILSKVKHQYTSKVKESFRTRSVLCSCRFSDHKTTAHHKIICKCYQIKAFLKGSCMDYYVKSVIPVIESNYENFTALEKNIADFFMKNEEKMDFSAKEIAKHLFVSEASLSRFAKKCGFRGYREFIYQYEESFEEKNKELTGHTRTVLNMYQELLNKTYSLMDEAQIVRICEKLGQAKRVFVCGKGSSGLAAREMRLIFMRIGVDINSIQDPDLMRMQAVFQKEGCLVIGISISGESEDVCYLLEESKKRGADTILITGKNKDDYEDICDELVLIASRKYLDHGNVISPQFPILIMLDLIYSYYLEHDKKKKETMHDDTVRALKGEKS